MINDYCPDCGEPLSIHRGVICLTATRYCANCSWCEVLDGDRQENAVQDWAIKQNNNRPYDPYMEEEFSSLSLCCGNYIDIVDGVAVCRSCKTVVEKMRR